MSWLRRKRMSLFIDGYVLVRIGFWFNYRFRSGFEGEWGREIFLVGKFWIRIFYCLICLEEEMVWENGFIFRKFLENCME